MTRRFDAIQPEDDLESRSILESELSDAVERHAREQELEREAYVRELILTAKDAFGRRKSERVEVCLHRYTGSGEPFSVRECEISPDLIFRNLLENL